MGCRWRFGSFAVSAAASLPMSASLHVARARVKWPQNDRRRPFAPVGELALEHERRAQATAVAVAAGRAAAPGLSEFAADVASAGRFDVSPAHKNDGHEAHTLDPCPPAGGRPHLIWQPSGGGMSAFTEACELAMTATSSLEHTNFFLRSDHHRSPALRTRPA